MGYAAEILTTLLPVLYALAAANSIARFVSETEFTRRAEKPLLAFAVGAHALAMALRAALTGRCPLGTVFEAMGLVAFSLAAVYLYLALRQSSRPTGILILPLAFLLEVVAVAFRRTGGPVNENLSNPWFSIHATAAVFGISALAVSFVHGIFYLLQYRQIKRHQFGLLFRRLPPLAALNRMTQMAAVVGWSLLTVTIAAGWLWAAGDDRVAELHRDPLFLITAGTWLLYSAGLGIRYLAGWRGRYSVYLSVCGFALLLVSMVLVSFMFPSLHEFR